MIGLGSLNIASGIVLLVAYVMFLFSTGDRRINRGIVVTLLIFLFYLAYSFFVAYNNTRAIALDFLMQIRPYLTFFIVMQMVHSFPDSRKRLLKQLCFSMWIFFIPLSIYGLINPVMFAGMVSQPTNYVSGVVILSLLYLYCCGFSLKERLTFLVMLSVGLIVVHARFYGFFILTCVILMFFNRSDILLSKLRTGIALVLVLGATVYISESQITDYLSARPAVGNEYGFAARSTLYQTAGIILKDFFPLGSGFASFASDASKTYYSPIYSDYGLSSVNGLTPQEWFPVSDSYYPSLAQFGIVGIALYLLFWAYIVWLAFSKLRKKGEIQPFVTVLILISFAFIENIFDSFFTSNKGVFMMMFLGVIFSKSGMPAVHRRKKKHFIPLETARLTDEENDSDAPFESGWRREEAGNADEADEEEQITDSPAIAASVPPLSAGEVGLPDAALSDDGMEEEMEDEYDDFEEYCDDESDGRDSEPSERQSENLPEKPVAMNGATVADGIARTETHAYGIPIQDEDKNVVRNESPDMENSAETETVAHESAPDGHVFAGDELPDEDGEDCRVDDSHEACPPPPSAPPCQPRQIDTNQRKTDMEKEFQEALEKIKVHAEEKRRLLKEKEAAGAGENIEKKDDSEGIDYII
ncbi:MAG: hypothetical protein LBS42_12200 [Tannerella sp.]|jgi:hypothetical protein|nr:hypothetical protein [Tannerella sp.]